MSLDDIVNVSITTATTTPTRKGFGTPLLAAYHAHWTNRSREYKSLKGLTDDGFTTLEPAYLWATKVFSQNPRPKAVRIGRRALAFTQVVHITPINLVIGYVYSFRIRPPNVASPTTITYTNDGTPTLGEVLAALATAIDALPDITATQDGAKVIVTTTAGKLADFLDFDEPANFTIENVSTDPGIATDLSAIETEDPDGWYCLNLDSQSQAEVVAAAAWIEAREKIHGYDVTDSECVDVADTNDVGSTLKAAGYFRTFGQFSMAQMLSYATGAWEGRMLPTDPGSATWAFKTEAGVTVDDAVTEGQQTVLHGKNINTYRTIAGVKITLPGKMASGEWIDVVVFRDWLKARLQERVLFVLANSAKIPFTDSGIAQIVAEVKAQLAQGIAVGGLAADPAPIVTAPKASEVDVIDKANRLLPDVNFTCTLAGAIHAVEISGNISV